MTVEQFLEEQNKVIQDLHKTSANSSWMAATTGEDEWNRKTAEAQNCSQRVSSE